jgi:hypothetical protein
MSEWKPIHTAPTETPVLITDGRNVQISCKEFETGDWEAGTQGFWYWDTDNDYLPTHWMPLPEVPWPQSDTAAEPKARCTGNDRSPPCGCDRCRTERAYGADAPF